MVAVVVAALMEALPVLVDLVVVEPEVQPAVITPEQRER
jgi:hypothetical protein